MPRRHLALRGAIFASMLSACGGACGPGVPILTYHSISDAPDWAVPEAEFAEHLDWLKGAGFHTVTLREVLDREDRKIELPKNPIVLTFDDGIEDNYARAFPMLRERGMRGTFFVVTRFLAEAPEERRVDDPGDAGREKRYMLWSEVQRMAAAGMEIGSHSLLHRRLTTLALDDIREDVRRSREELEARLGAPVQFFAYPFNSERRYVRRIVEAAGYRGACTGMRGLGDRFELPRFSVYRGMKAKDLKERLAEGWASGFGG